MKQTQTVRFALLVPLFFTLFAQSEIKEPNNQNQATRAVQAAKRAELAESIVTQAFSYLQKIDGKLTEIALIVRKGLPKQLPSSSASIMNVLTENKMTIGSLLQIQASIIALHDPEQQMDIAVLLTDFCDAFIPYLAKQVAENFQDAKPFDLDPILKTWHQNKTRSKLGTKPAVLKKRLKTVQTQFAALEIAVKNIGLTWYNKIARIIDAKIVTPANKWHIPSFAFYTGIVGALSLYLIYKKGYLIVKPEADAPQWLKDFVLKLYKDGPNVSTTAKTWGPIAKDQNGRYRVFKYNAKKEDKPTFGHDADEHMSINDYFDLVNNACLFAAVDWTINDLLLNNEPVAYLGIAAVLASFKKTWDDSIKDKIIKKRDDLWNFLRGGEYLNTFKPGLVQMKPSVSFKDMVGLDEVKQEFYQILQYINDPEQLMRIEATPEKGWLLTGPPRTGKTFSVECLCGEIELMMEKRGMGNTLKFFNINATLVHEFGIKEILDQVAQAAPAVIFIDEIDLLGLERAGNNKLLSDFLQAMQTSMNADPAKIVIVIAATNKPENIDSALRQNGRFGKEIRFDYPSRKYRINFLMRELQNMALNIRDFDIAALADKTNNKTFEDLKRVIRNAMTRSWMNGVSLTQELLEESIDTELNHIIMSNRKDLPENEMRIVATHFAGRALVAMHLETHEQLDKITTYAYMEAIEDESVLEKVFAQKKPKKGKSEQKKIDYGKMLMKQSHDTINVKNEAFILNEITVLLAGFAAEELLLGPCGFTCHPIDRDKAYTLLNDLVFAGIGEEMLPKDIREGLKMKAFNMLRQCHENAMQLLKGHHDALAAVIEELMQKQILNNKEIQFIIDKAEGRISEIDTDSIDDIFGEEATESSLEQEKDSEQVLEPVV